MFKKSQKIVVIGGGTGTYTVLSGLKKYPADVLELSAVVTVADSGGSTGRLRDEFGYLPVGDFRMALIALADDSDVGLGLRSLFLHRFDKGSGLKGHNFGNLFLVALTDIFGSEEKALEYAAQMLRIRGKVIPITNEELTLVAEYENNTILRGETHIDEPPQEHNGTQNITRLWVEPDSSISPKAEKAISEADLIIIGPGDLYTSILANIVVGGTKEAITASPAKLLYVTNLMSKYGQTHGFTMQKYLDELAVYIGRDPDYLLINNEPLPQEILGKYETQQEFPVEDDIIEKNKTTIFRTNLLADEEIKKSTGDALKRSLIRHDPQKLARAIMDIL
ncbi:hypothetical protein CL630_02510 [bacterium]|nr:hypothetical protein [bacterium]|tara:strand:- start:33392 stop:34399 length:1008 start_codon:yes stop_codon:yes gene_type:complete